MSSVDAWKVFLRGRVAQERGDNETALRAFDEALKLDPRNPNFLNAKAIVLQARNKSADAAAVIIERRYSELASRYVGNNDSPEPWIEGLNGLLDQIDRPVDLAGVVW